MRTRHRLSKLLLRQGIVYSDGQPGTGRHDAWLRGQTFAQAGLQLAFDAAYEAMLLTSARRDRLDAAITEMAGNSEFTDVVRRISLMAQKNAPLRLSFTDGRVTVSARTPDVGEASQSVEIPFTGTPFDVGFNPDFLSDGLELADGDLVLRLISPLRPGMLASANGGGYRYLIMPVRLPG